MRHCIIFYLILTGSFLHSQNEVIVNQYSQNIFGINASNSSLSNQSEANLYYKKLWNGFSESPEFSQITIDGPVKNKRLGLGLNVAHQQTGIFSYMIAQGSFSYKLKTKENQFLSFGLQGGIKRLQINFNKINAYDVDEFIDFPKTQANTLPTADFSISYSLKTLVIFISANQFLSGKFKYNDATYKPTLSSQLVPYYLVGCKWDKLISSKLNNSATIISRSHQGLPIHIEASDVITWNNKMSVGLGYRQTYSAYALARFQITQNVLVGYSYEYSLNKLNAHTRGGHEINLCYQFNSPNKEQDSKHKLSNKNLTDIYEQLELINKKTEINKKRTDTLDEKTDGLIDDINLLKTKQGNQEEIKYFMDSLKNSTLNVKQKRGVIYNTKRKATNKTKRKSNKTKQNTTTKQLKQETGLIAKTKVIDHTSKPIHENSKALETSLHNKNMECLVKDHKKMKLINSKLMVVDIETKEKLLFSTKSIGKWQGTINGDKKYKIICSSIGYHTLEFDLDSTKEKLVELFLEPMKVGENFIMKSIYFHPNSYALKKESEEELKKLLDYMIENPNVNIEIQGHTNGDNRIYKNKNFKELGDEWNFKGSSKKLSAHRATAIKNYLVNSGVTPERLVTSGMGGSKPIVENPETMSEGQRNIRVQIVILKD